MNDQSVISGPCKGNYPVVTVKIDEKIRMELDERDYVDLKTAKAGWCTLDIVKSETSAFSLYKASGYLYQLDYDTPQQGYATSTYSKKSSTKLGALAGLHVTCATVLAAASLLAF